MDDKTGQPDTQAMLNRLKEEDFPQMPQEAFIDENIKGFFESLFAQTGMQKSAVIQQANIDRNYGYQIINGVRVAERDYYLRIALVMQLDVRMTQRMLAVVGRSALHPLLKRDAAIIFAINNHYDNERLYDFLCELGLPPLEKDC